MIDKGPAQGPTKEPINEEAPWDSSNNSFAYITLKTNPDNGESQKFQDFIKNRESAWLDKLLLWLGKEGFHVILKNLSPDAIIALLEKIPLPTFKSVDHDLVEGEKKALYKKMGTIPDGRTRLALLRKAVKSPLGEPEPFPEEVKTSEGQVFSQPPEEPPVDDISEEDLRSMGIR